MAAILEIIAYVLAAIALAVVALVALCATAVFQPAQGATSDTVLAERMEIAVGPSALLVAGLVAFVAAVSYGGRIAARLSSRRRLVILVAYVLVVQVLWIGALDFTNPQYPDSVMLSRGAAELVNGHAEAFTPDYCAAEGALGYQAACAGQDQLMKGNLFNYLSWYPFQSGAMLWFALVYTVFGAQNFMAFQLISALAITGVAVILCRFAHLMGLDQKAEAVLQLLIGMCFPLLMFSAFVYTNAVGLAFTLLAALLLLECLRAGTIRSRLFLLLGSCVSAAIGVMVKNTFNILVLAMLIVLVLEAVRFRRWWLLGAGVVGYVLVLKSTVLPVMVMERLTGQSFGPGMPTLSWIAMGVQSKDGVLPGWWQSDALNVYLDTGGDYTAQQQHAIGSIQSAWSSAIVDPVSAFGFIGRKLSTEWAEPTFETVLYSGLGIRAHAGNGLARSLLAEPGRTTVNVYGDIMQSAVYVFALIAIVGLVAASSAHASVSQTKEKDKEGESGTAAALFLAIGFLGGFCCYVFWEAKSIYTLPFYILLLPFAARGLSLAPGWVRNLTMFRSRHRKVSGR
ncbi:hypothetical protein [Bifidobacterium myosotis]|uniref:Glycosyltransferase RgtA/B/C/D-like domain-containing protein n=1 Tax=Bifidobacterium myosotis TaxID=1630166 RepID=A0A5M9ZGD5_9BIFI|nr:hypothetical protein [Bifidobacterium myosotis]KAA8825469.1 hypothetical protein EMO91_12355 [Bifidobacterium myosotis]